MNRAGLNPKKQSSLFRRAPYEGDQKGNKRFFERFIDTVFQCSITFLWKEALLFFFFSRRMSTRIIKKRDSQKADTHGFHIIL